MCSILMVHPMFVIFGIEWRASWIEKFIDTQHHSCYSSLLPMATFLQFKLVCRQAIECK
jgi:hypothetical protein